MGKMRLEKMGKLSKSVPFPPNFLLFPINFTHFYIFPKMYFFLASHNSPFLSIFPHFPPFPIFPFPPVFQALAAGRLMRLRLRRKHVFYWQHGTPFINPPLPPHLGVLHPLHILCVSADKTSSSHVCRCCRHAIHSSAEPYVQHGARHHQCNLLIDLLHGPGPMDPISKVSPPHPPTPQALHLPNARWPMLDQFTPSALLPTLNTEWTWIELSTLCPQWSGRHGGRSGIPEG